jgi:hypothetical protein
MWRSSPRSLEGESAGDGSVLVADYVAAEDALRQFTDRNFGRMCAICARWTLYAARVNAEAKEDERSATESDAVRPSSFVLRPQGAVGWRLQSWVTNCCNANHALESMSEESLAGIVASREEGREWWQAVKRASAAPCAALTEHGCALQRGRPELCNRYFCEAVRDYLWSLGGEREGPKLAAQLDDLQRRWTALYAEYQREIMAARTSQQENQGASPPPRGTANQPNSSSERASGSEGLEQTDDGQLPAERRLTNLQYRRRERVRARARWKEFFTFLNQFDAQIARHARPVTADEMTNRYFKVNGERNLYRPFFVREVDAIGGRIRRDQQ